MLVLGLAAAGLAWAQQRPTAKEIIERIKAHAGVAWQEKTVDTIKAGDPNTPITGIATTMMATQEVLQKAAASGKNLVITHEPTFYSHLDGTETLQKENDRVWADKEKFIREHHMVVWRFHDHWHLRQPDGILHGVTRVLGWQSYQDPATPVVFTVPRTTLEKLTAEIRGKFALGSPRVVGRRDMTLTRVALSPGAGGPASHRRLLQRDDVDVLVIGEVPEWETIEYVADATAQGKRKALILMGHIPSEQAGMEDCAGWLKEFIHDVPVAFVAASEPFWAPGR